MSLPLLIAVVAAFALLVTALVTPVVRGAAIAMGMVRSVQEDRWHRRPTPAIGGVAIYVGVLAALAAAFVLDPGLFQAFRGAGAPGASAAPTPAVGGGGSALLGTGGWIGWTTWEGLLAGATAAFALGLADDFVHLRPATKLAGQVGAATILLLSGIGLQLTGIPSLDAGISLIWFVGITNAVNLLDNMDGLAAGVSAIAAATLAMIFVLDGQLSLVLLALVVAGALVGFLVHNYPPARIFMGDSGSMFLGLFLAGLALSPGEGLSRSLLAVVAVPALVLAIPILDTTVVALGRVLEGRPVSEGGKDHTSHRLVALGVPEDRAVKVLWALAALGAAVGLLFRTTERTTAILVGGMLVAGLVVLGAYFLSVRFRALGRSGVHLPLYRAFLELNERYPVLQLALDGVLVGLAYYAAYIIRWDAPEITAELAYFQSSVAVVVAAKLLAFTAAGIYGVRWTHFTLDDGFRLIRGSLLGTLAAAAVLLLVERAGLSRGVLVIDFMVVTVLLVASRLSFRLLEGAAWHLSDHGRTAVVLGPLEEIGLVRRALARERRDGGETFRPVAVADPGFSRLRARVGGLPLYGGEPALENALHDTRAGAVVVVGGGDGGEGGDRGREGGEAGEDDEAQLRAWLEHRGSVDVYRLRIELERMTD